MIYGEVAGIGKPVSRLVQGTVPLSAENTNASYALLDGVFENGCTAFDTAHVYAAGDCERILGSWVEARGLRDKVVVVTKGAHLNEDRNRVTPFDILSDIHDSLARLKMDYIDLYLLHRDDPDVEVGPIVEVLNELLEAGKVRAFGGSNWSRERVEKANAYAAAHGLTGFAVSSPQFSLVEQIEPPWPGCISIGGDEHEDDRRWYAENNIPVFAWSSLARGFLSGKYTRKDIEAAPQDEDLHVRCFRSEANLARLDRAAALANNLGVTVPVLSLAYLLHQRPTVFPLVGCETPVEFEDNAECFDIELTEAQVDWLDLRRETP